ncbi:MAG TPA: hypothetical protein DD381_08055 [Lentisphaeria bacterium]|nr:MAG: hypothetical protein A2X47_04620 [Lentisphaerae bacterium GWF2_38_69]HBM16275.1 hypothetical protein [Lentisphaeria bacterium]
MKVKISLLIVSFFVLFSASYVHAIAKEDFNYAIVVKEKTYNDSDWKEVVKVLSEKYPSTHIFTYKKSLDELVKNVTSFSPDYLAVVSKPEDADPKFIKAVNQFNRKLGTAPYGKAVLGIVTGLTAEDALRIAENKQKLEINFGLGGMLKFIDSLPTGIAYCEFYEEKENWQAKAPDTDIENFTDAPDDHLPDMVELINNDNIDGIWTSGHATPSGWLAYYPDGPSGINADDGNLIGYAGEETYPIKSVNPKIYLGIGNCLTACIEDKDNAYSLAWIHSGGVDQFFGYTVESYYGMMGWGMADYFFYRGGDFTLAESVFIINQALIMSMENDLAGDEIDDMAYDKDVCIVYGDPAWDARVPASSAKETADYEYSLTNKKTDEGKTLWTLKVTFNKDMNFIPESPKDIRPIFAFLSEKVNSPEAAGDLSAVGVWHVSDNFVIVNFKGEVKAGDTRVFKFTTTN